MNNLRNDLFLPGFHTARRMLERPAADNELREDALGQLVGTLPHRSEELPGTLPDADRAAFLHLLRAYNRAVPGFGSTGADTRGASPLMSLSPSIIEGLLQLPRGTFDAARGAAEARHYDQLTPEQIMLRARHTGF